MDNKLRFDFKTTQKIIQKIGFIDTFKGKWMAIQEEENIYLKELKRIATIQSIGSSTRIEGSTLTNVEVESLLDRVKINNLKERDEQEVFGYYDVLEIILDNSQGIEITEGNIFNLHNILLKYSSKDKHHKGRYKQLSNKVVANYPDGSQRVIFNTTEPFLVKKEMEVLIEWTVSNLKNDEAHPLITIGAFIYEFLSIHPFQDGNGRLSRLLTTLLLIRKDYHFIRYISFENHIEKHKQEYYRVLMNAQQHRYSNKEIIDGWILFFLNSLESLIKKLEVKYDEFKKKGPYLNDRQRRVIDFIKNNEPIRISDISKTLNDISQNTIKKDILYLRKENIISKIGKGRGTLYVMKPNSEND